MSLRCPVSNPNIVVRHASADELRAVDSLVHDNYVADGFWEDDKTQLSSNKFLRSPSRSAFVLLDGDAIVGTLSVIRDSRIGLPSDGTQLQLMRELRASGQVLAEVSAFAMDRSRSSRQRLVLFLMSYVMQWCFYYAGIDRLVASCKPEHAKIYQSLLGFSLISDLTYYDYSHASGYLISLDLIEAHRDLSRRYPPDPKTGQSFYSFLMRDPQPFHRFRPDMPLKRSRDHDWARANTRVA